MMSPRAPPPPIFPRDSSIPSAPVSPRTMHASVTYGQTPFPPPLPPPPPSMHSSSSAGYAAPRSYPGRALAPISTPSSTPSEDGRLVEQPSLQQHQHRSSQAPPPVQLHHYHPEHHSQQYQHNQAPPHTHTPPTGHAQGPYVPPSQSDVNLRRVSTSYDRILSSERQPTYSSPASAGAYPSLVSHNHEQRSDYGPSWKYNNDSENKSERSNQTPIITSPTYSAQKTLDEAYLDEQRTPTLYTTSSAEGSGSVHNQMQSVHNSQRYSIIVRQQPVAARACGFGERDRRVIDPPPIVQLTINNSHGQSSDSDPDLRWPFNVIHCTLWNVEGTEDETAHAGADKRLTRRLMGTLVASPFFGNDENGKPGCFFCFPDLSCRLHGKYRLRFVLTRIDPTELMPEGFTPILTEVLSDVFQVYTAKEFPGMRPSTDLTRALKRQGCAISVKKGNDKVAPGGAGSDDEEEPRPSSGMTSSAPIRRGTIPRKRTSSNRNGDL